MEQPIKVAICDPHEIALAGLSASLQAQGLEIVGTATDASSAHRIARGSASTVVLVDVLLHGAEHSAETIIRTVADSGGTAIAMGTSGDPEALFSTLRWGAIGYLTKDLPVRSWVEAVRAASRGEATISREMTGALIAEFRTLACAPPIGQLLPSDKRLTKREWQVLELIAEGKTNRTVAGDLSISVQTVRTHVSNILSKLETPNRSGAAARYQRLRAASH